MKIEQIKELKGMISQAVADDRMSQSCAVEIMDKLDAILALPLDTELLKKELIKFRNYFNNECYGSIEEWIIDEYIENKGIKYERD